MGTMIEACCLNKLKIYHAVSNEHIRKFCELQCLSEKRHMFFRKQTGVQKWCQNAMRCFASTGTVKLIQVIFVTLVAHSTPAITSWNGASCIDMEKFFFFTSNVHGDETKLRD